jgi:hypothetical protein
MVGGMDANTCTARKSIPPHKIRAILSFLNNYVVFKEKETNSIFRKEIDKITNKTSTMGIIEQIREMNAETDRKIAEREMKVDMKMAARQQKLDKKNAARESKNAAQKRRIKERERKFAEKVKITAQQQANLIFVKDLLSQSDFPVQKIASLVNVSLYFVRKVKKSLK